nr:translation initiation factor IF-2-like [Manis javanica]
MRSPKARRVPEHCGDGPRGGRWSSSRGPGEEASQAGREADEQAAPSPRHERRQYPFCSRPRQPAGPLPAHPRLCPRTAPPPFPEPLCGRNGGGGNRSCRRGCRAWARGIKLKLRLADLPRWAGEFGALATAQPLRGCPLAAPGNDQQVRRRGAERPAGKGCTSPWPPLQGSAEPAERSGSSRHPAIGGSRGQKF